MQKNVKPPVAPCSVSLVTPGKSSRLLAMRNKTVTAEAEVHECGAVVTALTLSPELLSARLAIEQRLSEIMAGLPPGKQRRLFKIRDGVELEQIRLLPIRQVFKVLDSAWPAQQNPATVMKLIGNLNYNGELA